MEQGKVFSEAILETGEELRSQRNLRDENDRLLSKGQNFFNGAEVDLCLSASRNAMDQKR